MIVNYTGITATSFTGCTTSGAGTMLSSSIVIPFPINVRTLSLALLQNIVGGNIGAIPNIGGDKTALGRLYTDQSKSMERGVYDFTVLPQSQWYPDPSQPTPGAGVGPQGNPAKFNVYCLDPYVWFIHRSLDISTYAFSLHDDGSNVQAIGTQNPPSNTTLKVAIGGISPANPDNGQPNKAEWSDGAQFGPVTFTGTPSRGTGPGGADQIKFTTGDIFNYLSVPNLAANVPGALVLGAGVVPQTRIASFDVGGKAVNLDTPLLASVPLQPADYSFFGPVNVTGTIDPSSADNKKIGGLDADTMKTLNKITVNGSLVPGALTVAGPGISPGTTGSTFATGAAGQFPSGVAVGDFNGDTSLDAAVANYGPTGGDSVSVLFGAGNGSFNATTKTFSLPKGTNPFAITTGKFDGSNHLSIVTGNFSGQSVTVFLGNGNGTFAATTIPLGHKIVSVAVGDLNKDGKADIVASSIDGVYALLFGNGNGTFQTPQFNIVASGVSLFGVAIGNFTTGGNTNAGLVFAAWTANRIAVLPGNGDGKFQAPIFTPVGSTGAGAITPEFLALGDFNQDGKIDVATANKDANTMSILLGQGDGSFQTATTYATGSVPLGSAVGDIDGDGKLDVAVANLGSNTGSIFLGNGNGSFASPLSQPSGTAPLAIGVGLFNPSKQALDLVFTNFVGNPADPVSLARYTAAPSGLTKVTSVGADFVLIDNPLDPNQRKGTFRFKIS